MTTQTTSLAGRHVLVTGATGGIGLETARGLAQRGAQVVLVGRNLDRLSRVSAEIKGHGTIQADLGERAEVRRAAAEYRERFGALDVLVNNAGAMYTTRQESREGTELTWAVNHLAPFLLTRELLPLLRRSGAGRVVTVASAAHVVGRIRFGDPEFRRGYSAWGAYAQSKLANILFARELARREPGLQSVSLHPGMVASGFGKNGGGRFARLYALLDPFSLTPEEGAQTSLYAATARLEGQGGYYADSRLVTPAPQALDDGAAERLWALSERYVDAGTV